MIRDGTAEAESSRAAAAARYIPAAPRVSQVDAEELDEGLVAMLGERVERALGNVRSSYALDLKPEIALALKLVIFRFGVLDPLVRASPGAKLQNLKLVSSWGRAREHPRRTLLLFLLLHPPIFPAYLLARIRQHALSKQWPDLPAHDWRRKAWKAIVRVEVAAKGWELLGWGMFLWDGRYPSLLMRLLGLRLVPASPHLTKLVSYEFMNRQLVWSAFTEFLMFSIPLLPPIPSYLVPRNLLAPLKSFFTQPTSIDYTSLPLITPNTKHPSPSSAASTAAHSGPLANLPRSICPICHLRKTSTPVPIASSSAGANISLPPVHAQAGQSSVEKDGDENFEEDTRIFVPAQTDCWGGCRWCYYCIGEELARHCERAEAGRKGARKEGDGRWMCLRCDGGVTRAWRVGADPDRLQDEGAGKVNEKDASGTFAGLPE